MTSIQTGVIYFTICIAILALTLPAVYKLQGRQHWYDEGWQDCEDAHNKFEMTPDDELVLKILKTALWDYMKLKGCQKAGDKKKLNQINDFENFKMFVWNVCIWRKGNK